ncbi:TetR/AcrR family transcriptional regulator [Ktedonosporobacter rubrisoli]|uniref:TetR/AcrR family transcriptional regulator n=1 Tax=Ktedonosporobacter rubrisoli TaxID=2509675 RepID=A0A4P6JXL8_KTERU|nr:TetR/AcrR family transcriptional regulator [Ktedonosporobacter rubrisoli]QBD80120.1 TetR/AcrR family transcriptional regulator [Ktedonosporobacter rubrisoli]
MMETSRRERLRAAVSLEIKQVAHQQITAQGISALTLRSIAKQMGFTPQAIYRYFENRDALISELIIDAYNDFAQSIQKASAEVPADAYGERLLSMLLAYRQWAIAHPVDFALIFGAAIPEQHVVQRITQEASLQVPALLGSVLFAAWRQGFLQPLPEYQPIPAEIEALLEDSRIALQSAMDLSDLPVELLHTMFLIWSRLHGLIMLEIGERFQIIKEPEALYRFEVLSILKAMGVSITKR